METDLAHPVDAVDMENVEAAADVVLTMVGIRGSTNPTITKTTPKVMVVEVVEAVWEALAAAPRALRG